MIELHTWGTPNGHKISIALEELALPYTVHPVNIGKGDQFKPEFLALSPNNKIPAIIDHEGPGNKPISIFESGAILLYLAEKTGKLLSRDPEKRWAAIEWIMFQVASVGPMFGQAGHFRVFAPEKIPYAIERYTNEAKRIVGVVEKRLGAAPYLAGDDYSIADIAVYPWFRMLERQEIDVTKYPNIGRWRDAIAVRPAVIRGLTIPEASNQPLDAQARENLFGKAQQAGQAHK